MKYIFDKNIDFLIENAQNIVLFDDETPSVKSSVLVVNFDQTSGDGEPELCDICQDTVEDLFQAYQNLATLLEAVDSGYYSKRETPITEVKTWKDAVSLIAEIEYMNQYRPRRTPSTLHWEDTVDAQKYLTMCRKAQQPNS